MMRQPLLDLDLKRVTREYYITGIAAINFPSFGGTTGGWHSMAYWDRDTGTSKVSLAGIHYSDTKAFFGDVGIFDVTHALISLGWHVDGQAVWMADHYRAAADMIARWALSDSKYCNVEIDDWFPAEEDRQRFLDLLATAWPRLHELGRLEKVEYWLRYQ